VDALQGCEAPTTCVASLPLRHDVGGRQRRMGGRRRNAQRAPGRGERRGEV